MCLTFVVAFVLLVLTEQNVLAKINVYSQTTTTPIFVTFDSGIPTLNISENPPSFVNEIEFVWGASTSHVSAWRKANPNTKLSYYMPYSRAPAASLGFDLTFWKTHHPDWILYKCDQKTVAFWDGEHGNTGSVPLDFTNPNVIDWQVRNQSVHAANLGYDMMAFDNYGGGARAGANPGQACGVFDLEGNWQYKFGQNSSTFNEALSRPKIIESSVIWIESIHERMKTLTPGLGIIPNLSVDNSGWVHTENANRVLNSITGALSERGFSGWGSQRVLESELLDEFYWMKMLASSNKTYYSINELAKENFHEEWIEFCLGSFYVGYTNGSSIWIGGIQSYGSWSYQSQYGVAKLGTPTSERYNEETILRRNYTNGIVILNPTQNQTYTFMVDSNYRTLSNQTITKGSTLTLKPQNAKILLCLSKLR